MTLLAEGTLRVDNFSVAKQATSLSSSKANKVGSADRVPSKEEGAAFAGQEADTVVSISSQQLTRKAEATDEKPETELLVDTADEKVGEATQQTLEEARKAETDRLEQISKELNEKLNESLSLRFGHDDQTGRDFFQLIEKDSGDVVRQIPSEDILDFMRKFKDFSGLLFSQQA